MLLGLSADVGTAKLKIVKSSPSFYGPGHSFDKVLQHVKSKTFRSPNLLAYVRFKVHSSVQVVFCFEIREHLSILTNKYSCESKARRRPALQQRCYEGCFPHGWCEHSHHERCLCAGVSERFEVYSQRLGCPTPHFCRRCIIARTATVQLT